MADPTQTLNRLVKAARQVGRLVYEHRQEAFLKVGSPGPWGVSYNGYCVAMALEWCRLRMSNDDFDFDRATRTLRAPPLEILRLHARIVATDIPTVLAEMKMVSGHALACYLLSWPNMAVKMASSGSSGLYLITYGDLKGASADSTHVVAVQYSGGASGRTHQRYFDANLGHFLFDNMTTFGTFMTHVVDNGYKALGYRTAYILPVMWSGSTSGTVADRKKIFGR